MSDLQNRGSQEIMDRPLVQFLRGSREVIDNIDTIEDGRLFFATDTKQIMLDCDFTDSANNNYSERITFGGSTGIYYADRTFTEDEIAADIYIFSMLDGHLGETITELPDIDDLILNTKDGSFYRVVHRDAQNLTVEGAKLTISGSGGSSGGGSSGGGGYISRTLVSNRNLYVTHTTQNIPVIYTCYSTAEGASISATVFVGTGSNRVQVDYFPDVSQTEQNIINIAKYMSNLRLNSANTITIQLEDDYSNLISVSCTVYVYNMYVTLVGSSMILPQENDYPFQVRPYGGRELGNRALVYELRRAGSESIVWKSVDYTDADNSSLFTKIIPKQEHGEYELSVYLQGQVPNSTEFLTSPALKLEIPFYNPNASSPLITATSGIVSAVQYDKINIDYMITYGATNTSFVKLLAQYDSGTGTRQDVASQIVEINNKQFYKWPLVLDKAGTYYLQIMYLDSNKNETDYVKILSPIITSSFDEEVPVIDSQDSSLMIYFNANNKSNNDIDKESWVSNCAGGKVKAQFTNFNWITNGWTNNIDGYSLHLTNGAKLVIPYSPFAADSNGLGAENSGRTIELDFKISNVRNENMPGISCRSYSIVQNEDGTQEEVTQVGFQIYGNKSQMNSAQNKSKITDMSGWTTIFKPGVRVHLTYVINSLNDTPERMFYTFLNGVVSSLSSYTATDQFIDLSGVNQASQFIFDSTYMDIDIYNIRVYQQSLRPHDVLHNYNADSGLASDAAKAWKQNNILITFNDGTTGIDLEQVNSLENIPYMVFYDGRETGSKKDEGWMDPNFEDGQFPKSDESRLPTGKKDFRHMEMYYVDPIRGEKYNIGTPDSPVIVTCYAQGTSSMEYPVKNLRIQFRKQDDGTHPNQISKYSLEEGLPAVNLFCLKADYMESSSAHNTGTANILDELYGSIGLKSPAADAYPDDRIITAILGHPIVCFYKPYKASADFPDYYQYIGRYNFNLDKSTHELFGFESSMEAYGAAKKPWGYLKNADGTLRAGFNSALEFTDGVTYYSEPDLTSTPIAFDSFAEEEREKEFEKRAKLGPLYEYKTANDGVTCIQCWEFLNNTSPLVGFRQSWDEEVDKVKISHKDDTGAEVVDHAPYGDWTGAFESRFPEHTDEASSDKRTFARMINWVASTNRHPTVVAEYLTSRGIEPTAEAIVAERELRLEKFNTEFADYFVPDFVAFYYVITEFLLMIDSRAKNMMMACFDADPENNTGHWMPIFYDMDTMLGVDNSGNLRFPYSQEDTQLDTFNAAGTYDATQYSVLWCNYREARFGDIKAMYHKLRKGGSFNYARMLRAYNNDQADAWKEVYINEDADYKYIDPLVSGYEVWFDPDGNIITADEAKLIEGSYKKTAANYLYAAQGTRSQHRNYWLEKRFNYLDSKYNYSQEVLGSSAGSGLNFRLNSDLAQGEGKPAFSGDFDFISLADQYVTVDYAQGNIVGPVRVYANTPLHVTSPFATSTDQEMYIYGLDDIVELGDLSTKYFNKFQLNRETKLRKLILGSHEGSFNNPNLGNVNIFSIGEKGANVPFLEELNIENCSGIANALDLSACPYLQRVYAKGSRITEINFFAGGNLQHIELPGSTTALTLNGQLFFNTKDTPENLTLESYRRLQKLFITNCPQVDSKSLFINTIYDKDNGDGTTTKVSAIQNIRLDDLMWTFEPDECTFNDNNVLTNIPLLDLLMEVNGLTTNGNIIAQNKMNNDYIAGTIIINNGDTYGINELTLYEKYNYLFPNIQFVYQNNSLCTKAYSININNSQSQILYDYSKKLKADDIANYNDNLLNWFTPVVLKYSEITDEVTGEINKVPSEYDEQSHLPPLTKQSSAQYVYNFRGWSIEKPKDFSEKDYHSNADRDAAIEAALVIKVSHNLDNEGNYIYTAEKMNDFDLTLAAFGEDQVINFYPVYAADLNTHIVRFFDGINNDKPIKIERVKYGESATPPISPQKIELPKDDVTVAYVYPFLGYNLPYNNITSALNTYAQYGTKQSMATLTGDQIPRDCFEVNIDTYPDWEYDFTGRNIIKLRVKSDFTGEAIIVPKEWTNEYGMTYPVVQIDLFYDQHDYCTTLRRMFFEKGNEITAIGEFLDRSTEGPLCNNFEYLDFSALSKLKFIGHAAFHLAEKMLVTSLPNSIEKICANAFGSMPNCRIQQLPQNLKELCDEAFSNCHNLQLMNINTATQLATIGGSAFQNCINLVLADETIIYPETIGSSAFRNCSKLVLNFATANQSQIRFIEKEAFYNSARGLQNLPPLIEKLGASCFMADNGSDISNNDIMGFSVLPETLRDIGSGAFQNRTTASDIWYLQTIDPSQIKIAQYAFESVKNLNTLQVNWNLTEAAQIQPYLSKGWTIHGTVTVVDEDGNSLND